MSAEIVPAVAGEKTMDRWVVRNLIDFAAGRNGTEHTKTALREEIRETADELAGPSPTPLERMLAEVVAVNWFALRLYDVNYLSSANNGEGMSFKQGEYLQRRIDRAHSRLMSSLKTLATVRKLGVPALQINLARNQINMAGSHSGEAD